ncbi:MAG: DUF6265 family protein [Bacteroidales bacterium]|jgi:hypothetical protein|nr:DUF6265 family protein [Bacteroidales bacterium]
MKKFILSIIIVSLLVCFTSCGSKQKNSVSKVEWLIGTWMFEDGFGGVSYESWEKISNNELKGRSYVLAGNDTVVFENINIKQENNNLFYTAKVTGHNDDMPITFPLKSITEEKMEFENLQHDFPQMISYRKINNDSLVAEVSGIQNGEISVFELPMRKSK